MKLTVLGSSGGYPEPGRACTGFLVESDGTSIWIDAGTGTLGELLRKTNLFDLDAILMTHLHADHWTDLPIALHQRAVMVGDEIWPPIPVHGPPGWPEATGVSSQWFAHRQPITFQEETLEAERTCIIGNLTITAAKVEHSLPTVALRVTDGAHTIVYSADTSPCDALRGLADEADLFLCEATLPAGQETLISMNPAQAATVASDARASRLVLTHLLPGIDPEESCAVARNHFPGPVNHADQGRVFELS